MGARWRLDETILNGHMGGEGRQSPGRNHFVRGEGGSQPALWQCPERLRVTGEVGLPYLPPCWGPGSPYCASMAHSYTSKLVTLTCLLSSEWSHTKKKP